MQPYTFFGWKLDKSPESHLGEVKTPTGSETADGSNIRNQLQGVSGRLSPENCDAGYAAKRQELKMLSSMDTLNCKLQ